MALGALFKRSLRIESQRNLTLFVRFISIAFVPLYVWGLFDLFSDQFTLANIKYFAKLLSGRSFEFHHVDFSFISFMFFLVLGLAVNFGPFFITTPLARRLKVCATIAYAPTLFLTPIILAGRDLDIFFVVLIIGSMVVYDRFNPWRL